MKNYEILKSLPKEATNPGNSNAIDEGIAELRRTELLEEETKSNTAENASPYCVRF